MTAPFSPSAGPSQRTPRLADPPIGRSGHFRPLASQDELDADRRPHGWWILPFGIGGCVGWYFIIRALAHWIAALAGAVL